MPPRPRRTAAGRGSAAPSEAAPPQDSPSSDSRTAGWMAAAGLTRTAAAQMAAASRTGADALAACRVAFQPGRCWSGCAAAGMAAEDGRRCLGGGGGMSGQQLEGKVTAVSKKRAHRR